MTDVEGSATRLPDTQTAVPDPQTVMTAAASSSRLNELQLDRLMTTLLNSALPAPPPTHSQYGAQSSQYLQIKGIRV